MWPSRRFADLVGIEHPIVQAPMAGTCTPALAAAVSNAGGLGAQGCAFLDAAALEERVGRIRQGTNRAFALNFFAHRDRSAEAGAAFAPARAALEAEYETLGLAPPEAPPTRDPAAFDAARLEALLTLRPPVVTFHFGLPAAEALAALREAGIRLGATATTTAEARRVEAAGCDFVVAQGFEAGGHRGAHDRTAADGGVGLTALVPQVADAVSIPVVAAGGIGDARGIAAAFALGADGVQMGSAFLRTPEAATDAPRRARLETACDSDTVVTAGVSGHANRVAASPFVERRRAGSGPLLPFPLHYALTDPLRRAGGETHAAHQYGQAAALARAVPAAELMAGLVAETRARLAALARP